MGGESVQHPDKVIISFSNWPIKILMPDGRGNPDHQSSPNPDQGGDNINRKLRKAEVFMEPDYHNPNPWTRILGSANESEIEIDGIKSKL